MSIKSVITFCILLLISVSLSAQNEYKIDTKLNKIYKKGAYSKLEKQALKYKKRYPRANVPNYYLSKLEIIKFNKITATPNKKQWSYLRKASNYSKKLSGNYSFWQDSIKTYYIIYINSWDDYNYQSDHLKKVVKAYSSTTKDTLDIYYSYVKRHIIKSQTTSHKTPITDSIRGVIIARATKQVGISYVYAGETPDVGFDCSGFVKYVYKGIDIELPHSAQMQSELKGKILTLEEAKPGDLIFFGTKNGKKWRTQHAGIIYEYTKDEPKVIHCVSRGVCIDGNNSSWEHYWKDKILFIKRLPQLEKQIVSH